MRTFEKELAVKEAQTMVCSYPYKVIPLTEQAKLAFALYSKKRGPADEKNAIVIKKYLDMDKHPFVGRKGFYYDDPSEPEEKRKAETKDHAIWLMTESNVPGISHRNSGKRTYYRELYEGVDYEIQVGEKIIHNQPERLTFEDIKTL